MKKIYMALLAAILLSASSFAQSGNVQLSVGGDLSFPTGDFGTFFKTGIGVYAKSLFGVGTAGQVTISLGYSNFTAKGSTMDSKFSLQAIPLLVGYRHNFKSAFFIEPQIGYAIYGVKASDVVEGYWTDSDGAFTWAATVGYIFNKQVEVSARYQNGSKGGSGVEIIGLHVGYNFKL